MDLFNILDMSGRAMTAQRQRAEVVTANMANAETTRTPEGGPYVRKHVIFQADQPLMVQVFIAMRVRRG